MKNINPNLHSGHNGSRKLLSVHIVASENSYPANRQYFNFVKGSQYFPHPLSQESSTYDWMKRQLEQIFTDDYTGTKNS